MTRPLHEPGSDLAPDLAALLEAERRPPPLAPARREAIRQRVAASLARPPTPPTPGVPVALVTALAAGVALTIALWPGGSPEPVARNAHVAMPRAALPEAVRAGPTFEVPPTLAHVEPVVEAIREPAVDAVRAPAVDAVQEPVVDVGRTPGAATAPEQKRPEPARRADATLERPLLDRAQTALLAGDLGASARALAEHARRFPRGALTEEREVLGVRVLARRGETAMACRAAEAFAKRFPRSIHGPAVDAVCSDRAP